MNTRGNNLAQPVRCLLLVFLVALSGIAIAQKDKAAKSDATGSYQGTAKNRNEEAINVTFELTEKQGLMSGVIHSDHGDFNITGGKHDGSDVTLEFDTNGGPTGTITLKLAEDKMSGTWTAGDDGGPVEVKKVAADASKAKS
jgi:hypothetical protein